MDREQQLESVKTLKKRYDEAPPSLKATLLFYLKKMYADFKADTAKLN